MTHQSMSRTIPPHNAKAPASNRRFRPNLKSTLAPLGVAAVLAASWLSSAHADALGLLVPAYIFPEGDVNLAAYRDLADAASRIPVTVILNPASGPGTSASPAYNAIISDIKNAGGNVIGYIPSTFGNRPAGDIVADVQLYRSLYGEGAFDGFFIDEFSNDPGDLGVHRSVYNDIKGIDPSLSIVANPGLAVPESFFSVTQPTADTVVVFENFASSYPSNDPPAFYDNLDSSRLAQIVHTVPTSGDIDETVTQIIDQAVSENTGWIFATDDTLPNPFDTLPSFFDSLVDEVEAVNAVPEPASVTVLSLLGLALVKRNRRG